jgi:hypothetical protein
LSRRVLLRGAAAGAAVISVASCSGGPAAQPSPTPSPPDPQTVLLGELIAGKLHLIELYQRTAAAMPELAPTLRTFEGHHRAHLAELRRRLPPGAKPPTGAPASDAPATGRSGTQPADAGTGTATAAATPGATGAQTPGPESPGAETARTRLARLRSAERSAAAARPDQLATVSPSLAQLIACMGACEAGHATELARLPGGGS